MTICVINVRALSRGANTSRAFPLRSLIFRRRKKFVINWQQLLII